MISTPRRLALIALVAVLPARPAAANWPVDGAPICTAPSFQTLRGLLLDLETSGDSGPTTYFPFLFAVWEDGRAGTGQDTDIYCQVFDGAYGSPYFEADGRPVIVAPGFQLDPVAALCDGTHPIPRDPTAPCTRGFLVAWRDSRGVATTIRARKMNLFCPALSWPDTGVQVSPYAPLAGSIGVTGDPLGGGIVAWIDSHTGSQQVYAQRFDTDGNALWAPGGIAVAAPGTIQDQLAVGPGGGCDAYLAWMEYHPDDASLRLVLLHLGDNGQPVPGWEPAGKSFGRLSFQEPGSLRPRVLADGSGGAIVVWENTGDQSPDGDIAAQRFLADGSVAPGWPVGGRAITAAPGQQLLAGASARGGRCLAVWNDSRPNAAGVYAQSLTPQGDVAPGWDANGQPVYTGGGSPTASAAVCETYGGSYVGWTDSRDGDIAPYVVLLTPAGVADPYWPADGLRMTAAPGAQGEPLLASDGLGGVVAAWNDSRNLATSSTDIYAQIANRGAKLDAPPPSRPARLALGPARPNPARRGVTLALDLPAAGRVRADVLDVAGWSFRRLRDEDLPAGHHDLTWDGRADDGSEPPAGIYFVRVRIGMPGEAGSRTLLRRMARLR